MENTQEAEQSWWEYKLGRPFWMTVWDYLLKLNMHKPYSPAIPLLVPLAWKTFPSGSKIHVQKVHGNTMCKAKTLYTTYTSINIRMKSFWYIHSMEDHIVVKIKELQPNISIWLNVREIILSKNIFKFNYIKFKFNFKQNTCCVILFI